MSSQQTSPFLGSPMRFAHFEFDPENDRLGEGPLSEVYRAVDVELGRTVALKILRPHAEIDPASDVRFKREAQHTSLLKHPNIATIYECGKDHGTSYIAMEFLEGRTLDTILKERQLGFEECLRIARAIASALAVVHRSGLIHRDLKPGNVMVLDDGTVKLMDFGIARASNEASITQHGMLVGTVLYMSPEQVRGDELDARSDIFALGSVLYHMSTGMLPFPGKSFPEVCMAILDGKPRPPTQVRLGLPTTLEDLIQKCLAPEPFDRFQDAEAVLATLVAGGEGASNGSTTAVLPGSIVIPPMTCANIDREGCAELASSLRKDLATALRRTRGLRVLLPENPELPQGEPFDFVLRARLRLDGAKGLLDLNLERYDLPHGSPSEPREVLRDSVEYDDLNEFGLEAGLVSGAVRTVKKRLSEIAQRPAPAARRDPVRAEALVRSGVDVLLRGKTKHLLVAMGTLKQAIEVDPQSAAAYAGLAGALVRQFLYFDGEASYLEQAREHAARALAIDPRCATAHTALGFGCHLSGHPIDAEREYRLAIQLDHGEWLAHRLLGAVLSRAGNYKEAAPLLRRAINLKPTHIGSYDHLHDVLQRLNRYQEAIQIAEAGIAAARAHLAEVPDNMEARLHLAMLLARMGSHDEARAEALHGREMAPRDGYTAFHTACVLAIVGDLAEAIEALKAAQSRGYYIASELVHNTDLDVLRGLPEFKALAG
jgi:tetratricopeptide (TPR) repeat protein/predicted Ser/Thr protein kinase